jgi:hypothetical protein
MMRLSDPPPAQKTVTAYFLCSHILNDRKRSIGSYLLSVIRYYKKYEPPFDGINL